MKITHPSTNELLAQTVAFGMAGAKLWSERKPVIGKPSPKAKLRARRVNKLATESRRRNRK